jgi:hypothetical protein
MATDRKAAASLMAFALATSLVAPAHAAKPACELRISENGHALVDATLRKGFDGKDGASYILWIDPAKVDTPGLVPLSGTTSLQLAYSDLTFSPNLMLPPVRTPPGHDGYLDVELDIDGQRSVSGDHRGVNYGWEFPGRPAPDSIKNITVRIYTANLGWKKSDPATRTLQPAMVLTFSGEATARANARAQEAIATLRARAGKRQCDTAAHDDLEYE